MTVGDVGVLHRFIDCNLYYNNYYYTYNSRFIKINVKNIFVIFKIFFRNSNIMLILASLFFIISIFSNNN